MSARGGGRGLVVTEFALVPTVGSTAAADCTAADCGAERGQGHSTC